jgi:hypothetical protein
MSPSRRPRPSKPARPVASSSSAAGKGRGGPRRSVRRAAARPKAAWAAIGGRQARRPGPSLLTRVRRRLPRLGRLLAVFLSAASVAALVALVAGPWLRVTAVEWRGERLTAPSEIAERLDPVRGATLLSVDTAALATSLERLPTVADAHVTALLPDRLEVSLTEKQPAFLWQTRGALLLAAADGTLVATMAVDATLPEELAALPRIVDDRRASRYMEMGDVIPREVLATAEHLASLDPKRLGSDATRFGVRVEDEFGFVVVPEGAPWRAAFGFYGTDPGATIDDVAARVERQVTDIRTLFATQPERTVGWVDVRNPGRVYFRAGG